MEISNTTIDWITGLIGVIIFLGVILTFITQIKKVRTDNAKETQSKIDSAVKEARIESESASEYRQLKEKVNETNTSINSLSTTLTNNMTDLYGQLRVHDSCINELKLITKATIYRINEHRLVEHKWTKDELRREEELAQENSKKEEQKHEQ